MKRLVTIALCASFAALATAVRAQFTVNFQYKSSEGGVVATYNGPGVPGYGSGTFWNIVPGPSSWNPGTYTSASSYGDDGVTDTSIAFTMNTDGSWTGPDTGGIPLLDSYADSYGSANFVFSNVPDGTYNLVLFSVNGKYSAGGGGNATTFTVGGVQESVSPPSTDTNFIQGANFVVFTNLPVAGGTLTGTWNPSPGSGEGDMDGAQLQRVSASNLFVFPPTFAPTNTVWAGVSVTVSANAVGTAPLEYEWQTDGGSGVLTNIPGATASQLQVDTSELSGSIQYAVVVTNSSGLLTAGPVTLTVNVPLVPSFTPDPPAVTPSDTVYAGGQVTFTTTLSGTPPIACQWEVDKGAGFVDVSASATNATLTLTNLQLSDAGTYCLAATNSAGGSLSQPVALTVNPAWQAFIQWSAPAQITTADATLTQASEVVGAEVFAGSETVVLLTNFITIDFKADGSVATTSGSGTSSGVWAGNTGNADFNSVLDQYNFNGGPKTITLYKLMV